MNKKDDVNINNKSPMPTILGIISLVLYFLGSFLFVGIMLLLPNKYSFFGKYFLIFSIIGIVVMIIGKIKYPKSLLLNITMWLIIGSILLAILLIVLFIILGIILVSTGVSSV